MTLYRTSVPLVVVAVLAGTWFATSHPAPVGWAAAFAVPLVALVALRRWSPSVGLSPLLVATLALVATGALGLIAGGDAGNSGGISAPLVLDAAEAAGAAWLFVLSACALLFGGTLVLVVRASRTTRSASFPGPDDRELQPVVHEWSASAGTRSLALICAAVPLVGMALTMGSGLLSRGQYLAIEEGSIGGVFATLGVAAVVVCGFVMASEAGLRRVPGLVLTIAYVLTYFGSGSRRLALVFPLVAVGVLLARPGPASRRLLWVAAGVGVLLLPIPLYLRGGTEHGIGPYLAALPDLFSEENVLAGAANNLLFSFPLAGHVTYQAPSIPISTILTEINPLPGWYTNWEEIAANERVNEYTPYSAIGVLGNLGWGAIAASWVAVGMFFGYLEGRVDELAATGQRVVAIALTGMPILIVLFALQYNLRTTCRLVLYTAIIDIACRATGRVRAFATNPIDSRSTIAEPVGAP